MNNKFKTTALPIIVFISLCILYYSLIKDGIINNQQNFPQLLLSALTLCLGLFGVLRVEHWRKDKIRSVIFVDCVNLKKSIVQYGLHIQTTTNLVYGKNAMLRIKNNDPVIITQESLNKVNIELYHELRHELSEMLENITLYFTLKKYINDEYKASFTYLVDFYGKYLKSMYYPINEEGYSELFIEVCECVKTSTWKEHVNRVTEADLDMLFTLDDL